MCTYSMISDHYLNDRWPRVLPQFPQLPGPSQVEFDALKKEVEMLRELLKKAKIYDEETGQRDCETDDKVDLLKKIAKHLGVDMDGAV